MAALEPPDPRLADDALRDGIAVANVPVLLLLLFQITGDRRWIEAPYLPSRNEGLGDNSSGGFDRDRQGEIRAAAFDALRTYRDTGKLSVPDPDPAMLTELLGVSMGEPIPGEYGPMVAAELGIGGVDSGRLDPPSGFEVLVIGAGLSGIAAAVALKEAGISFSVVEKEGDVGGTWLRNRYPGCGVDTPSSIYSYSFQPYRWSRFFAQRDEVYGYLRETAESAGILPHIQFGEEVESAVWDEPSQRWKVRTLTSDGVIKDRCASFVITAVGAFSRPKAPDIPGLDSFAGRCAHTADWPADLEVAGKRVAVIGNGASAMQVVPAIVRDVAELTVFQRAPHWVAPFEQFEAEVPAALQTLMEAVPLYRRWYRVRWGWTFNDRLYSSLQKDPAWPHPERAVGAENDRHRAYFTRYLEAELADRPDLAKALTPNYPPFGKRILLDNGWFRALSREHVELVSERVERIEGSTLFTGSGRRFEVDVLILATGFDVVNFLAPMDIRGRSGRSLRALWQDDDARAYLGTTVPGFPNLAMLYGPNIQPGHGGSLVGLAEIQVSYILDLLGKMFAQDLGAVDVAEDTWTRYNQEVDAAHEKMVWTHPGMTTYYRNSSGRVVVPGPFRVVDLWHRARHANIAGDYSVSPRI